MTKFLGTLVGALVAGSGFPGVSNFCKDGSDHILVRDTALCATSNVADVISLGSFKSTALLSPSCKLWWDACGAGCQLEIGDVNHVAGLTAALDVSAAGAGDLIKTFTAAKMAQPLWQLLGYGSDPGGNIELLATFLNANGNANVNLAWQIVGINR